MKVTSLIHFSLHTYIPIHFSIRGGSVIFLQGGKDKMLGKR